MAKESPCEGNGPERLTTLRPFSGLPPLSSAPGPSIGGGDLPAELGRLRRSFLLLLESRSPCRLSSSPCSSLLGLRLSRSLSLLLSLSLDRDRRCLESGVLERRRCPRSRDRARVLRLAASASRYLLLRPSSACPASSSRLPRLDLPPTRSGASTSMADRSQLPPVDFSRFPEVQLPAILARLSSCRLWPLCFRRPCAKVQKRPKKCRHLSRRFWINRRRNSRVLRSCLWG